MKCEFRIFHESNKPENAERAIKGMIRHNNIDLEIVSIGRYLDKGCLAICKCQITGTNWEAIIYEAILFCQSFGGTWQINDQIARELCLSTTHIFAGNGITLVDLCLKRSEVM